MRWRWSSPVNTWPSTPWPYKYILAPLFLSRAYRGCFPNGGFIGTCVLQHLWSCGTRGIMHILGFARVQFQSQCSNINGNVDSAYLENCKGSLCISMFKHQRQQCWCSWFVHLNCKASICISMFKHQQHCWLCISWELQGFNMYILNVQTTAAILLILMVRLTEEKWCPQPPKNSKAIN